MVTFGLLACTALAPIGLQAAQLSSDAKAAIPNKVQQLIVVDYHAIQNSPAAMSLKEKMMPPELKRLEQELKNSGLKVDDDVDVLALAAYIAPKGDGNRIVGVAQGQFNTQSIMAHFAKDKTKPLMLRNNAVYPLGAAGASVAFLNQTTMIFGDRDSVRDALDARDGLAQNFLQNGEMMNEMAAVDQKQMWSLLDQKGTQTMMKSVLGPASQIADYDTVRDRMKSSRYTMDFSNGVKFEMSVVMSDSVTAAMAATVMKGVSVMKKSSGTPLEKSAIDSTSIDSNSGTLTVSYAASDSQFSNLLTSPLFQSVVR